MGRSHARLNYQQPCCAICLRISNLGTAAFPAFFLVTVAYIIKLIINNITTVSAFDVALTNGV